MKDSFGTRLKFFRSKAGLSQQQLADSAGLSRKIISDYEVKLDVMPREGNLYKIADALGVDSSNLVPKSTEDTAFTKCEDGLHEYKININELPREAVITLRKIAEIRNQTLDEAFSEITHKAILDALELHSRGGTNTLSHACETTDIRKKEEEFNEYIKKAP